ncbi:MAG TPA: TetR/AcrR family transcriptional regulator [Nocardioidaceae bacterium]|nr:TetR/AcrR family transcriptional regulator [Nocardioidaceae bacterium]
MSTARVSTARVRLSPDARREQLLDLGVRMLATRGVDELSIDLLAEEAGVSRGLLYHYFGSKHEFHHAVVRRAADDVIRVTAPRPEGDPLERLAGSLEAYVDYVVANFEGYSSLVRGAASGNPALREIYEEARAALTDRLFEAAGPGGLAVLGVEDTPATRLMARGWSAMTEEVVLTWARDHHGLPKQQLLAMLTAALPAVLSTA